MIESEESEAFVDPRDAGPLPTPEEIESWTRRESARRKAWLAGPGSEEKEAFARRYRRRAAFGLEESRLGPTADEIEGWAGREQKRREAWLAGPAEEEKRAYARRTAAAEADVEAWAERERARRRGWAAGPSEDEKLRWAERQRGGFREERLPSIFEDELPEAARRLAREAELAAKGSLFALSRAPSLLWSYFIRAGREFERDAYQPLRRRRVPY